MDEESDCQCPPTDPIAERVRALVGFMVAADSLRSPKLRDECAEMIRAVRNTLSVGRRGEIVEIETGRRNR
jgi:hypothetical protein